MSLTEYNKIAFFFGDHLVINHKNPRVRMDAIINSPNLILLNLRGRAVLINGSDV